MVIFFALSKACVMATFGNVISERGAAPPVNDADGKLGYFGATPVVKQTVVAPPASDLASAIALINDLKAKLSSYGLV